MITGLIFTLVLLFTSSIFTCARPLPSLLRPRTIAGMEDQAFMQLVAQCSTSVCTCTSPGCNEEAILDILVTLKTSIDASTHAIACSADPIGAVSDVYKAITAAMERLASVQTNVSTSGPLVGETIDVIVDIIMALATCVTALGANAAKPIAAKMDAATATIIIMLKNLNPRLVGLLYTAVLPNVTLLQSVKYVLTLRASNLPSGY